MSDREWRLNNLYHIKDASGRKVVFKMNEVQQQLHDTLWFRNVVPKARKAGVSTFFSVLALDQTLFSENKTAAIIAHRKEDVGRLFRDIVMYSFENMHPWLKELVGKPDISSANEIMFKKNYGSMFVSLTTRGMTPNFLHISEFGYICKHSPEKADEIVSGAINSVAPGNFISIESTAEGRGGHFFDICMEAERLQKAKVPLTELDFRLHFIPWYKDKKYVLNAGHVEISQELQEYFERLKRDNQVYLTDEQKRWYAKQSVLQGDLMLTQFPSTLEECFRVSLKGSYYGKRVDQVYKDGRIGFFPVDPRYTVDTAWDLGASQKTDSIAIVFFQTIGNEIRIVDHLTTTNVGVEELVKKLREKEYRYGQHIFPHDVSTSDISTGVSRLTSFMEVGLNNIVVAPKVSVSEGIDRVHMLFSRFRFDQKKGQSVLDALQNYRREWDPNKTDWSSKPFHGPESHTADAVRYLCVVWHEKFGGGQLDEYGKPKSGDAQIVSFFS